MVFKIEKKWPLSIVHWVGNEESAEPHGHTWMVGIELVHHELGKDGYFIDPDELDQTFAVTLYEIYDESQLNILLADDPEIPLFSVTPEVFAKHLHTELRKNFPWAKYLTRVFIEQEPDFIISYSD